MNGMKFNCNRVVMMVVLVLALTSIVMTGCSGKEGAAGAAGTATGTVSGVVSDKTKGDVIPNAVVTATDTSGGLLQTATTDASGAYVMNLPAGPVLLLSSKSSYTCPAAQSVGVLVGQAVTVNFAMKATGLAVEFNDQFDPAPGVYTSGWENANNTGYGATVSISAAATGEVDLSSALTYTWKNFAPFWGTWATAKSGTVIGSGPTATVTFSTMAACFAPRSDAATFQYIAGYTLPDRLGPLTIPHDKRGLVAANVVVTDDRGQKATISGEIYATDKLTGLRNVALGERIYLNRGNDDSSQTWVMTQKPDGSTAVLTDPTSRTPYFFPDVVGAYVFTVGGKSLTITAGTYLGVITGIDSSGNPKPDPLCTTCHNGVTAPDKFTPWVKSGMSKILSIDWAVLPSWLNAYCTACHTVGGMGSSILSGGFASAVKSTGYSFNRAFAMANPATEAWPDMVHNYPAVARLANVQCESCHGPQSSSAHSTTATNRYTNGRISYAAESCTYCHYDRSQWGETTTSSPTSGNTHMNRERALLIGTDPDCGRCHSAQGFLAYTEQLSSGNVGTIVDTRWSAVTAANVEPVTCQACHDPHGTNGNTNQNRLDRETPMLPAGFSVNGVGQGALCIACHNSARGAMDNGKDTWLHEDTGASGVLTYDAPHGSQSDVFFGRNAWFMGNNAIPMISKHSAVSDTCVHCHTTLNPSAQISIMIVPGTKKHQFWIDPNLTSTLCNSCHGGTTSTINPSSINASIEAGLEALAVRLDQAALAKISAPASVQVANAVDSTGAMIGTNGTGTFAGSTVSSVSLVVVGNNKIGLNLLLSTPATIGGSSVSTLNVPVEFLTSAGTPLYLPNSNFIKGAWNYFLVKNDKSQGVHNFTFVQSVINTTFAQTF
jgi:hypothetical protein